MLCIENVNYHIEMGFQQLLNPPHDNRGQEVCDKVFESPGLQNSGSSLKGSHISLSDLRWAKYETFFCPWDLEVLGCSKRSGKLINRKIGCFYLEIISNKFSQLRKKYFFRSPKKYVLNFSVLKMLCFRKDSLIRTVIGLWL